MLEWENNIRYSCRNTKIQFNSSIVLQFYNLSILQFTMLINCHSWFSLKYGTISPEKLLEELSNKGFTNVALTDINNTSASIDFVRMAEQYNIKPVLGIDFRNGIQQKYIGLAKNMEGFKALNEHLTTSQQNKLLFEESAPEIPIQLLFIRIKTKENVC